MAATSHNPADAVFEAERPRLTGLAYRMLGSIADAEDVVQSAWIRWRGTDTASVERPAAWLTTVVSRLAIDRMRQQQRRREDYVGPWLPEPVPTAGAVGAATGATGQIGADPAHAAELADSVTFGFLVLLDRLSPVERAVFVLADVFGEPYGSIAALVDKTPQACRQIASRARRRVRQERADRAPADPELLADLLTALAEGAADRVVSLMSPEVVLTSDGGPVRRAARRPVLGPHRVSRFLVNLASKAPPGAQVAIEELNGAPAVVIRSEELTAVLSVERSTESGRIGTLHLVLNPDKLGGLDRPATLR